MSSNPETRSAELASTFPVNHSPTATVRPGEAENAMLLELAMLDGAVAQPEMLLSEGRTSALGAAHLHVESFLGEGGLGTVEGARQNSLSRLVAVKRVRADRRSTRAEDQLRREAMLMGRLEHPAIPPVHGLGQDADGNTVLVMKLVEGRSWLDVLREDRQAETARLSRPFLRKHIEILVRIGEAVAYGHTQGILHRDVKPENVILGDYGEVYLLDWGIAVELDDDGCYTGAGFVGTPCYAAPEMLSKRPLLDVRTDIYLLAATLHHVLTGRPPHDGGTTQQVIESALMQPTPARPPNVPGPLAEICSFAMAADPEDRFASVEGLLECVRHYLDHSDTAELHSEAVDLLGQLKRMAETADASVEEFEQLGQRCRYDLERVHHAWPEDESVAEQLRRCLLMLCDHAISRRRLAAARILLDQFVQLVGDDQASRVVSRRNRINALAEQLVSRSDELSVNIQVSLVEQLADQKRAYDELMNEYNALRESREG